MKTQLLVLFLYAACLSSCAKDDKPASTETYFFSGNVDNSSLRWQVNSTANESDTSKYQARAHYFYSQWPMDCATSDCYDVAAGGIMQQRNQGNAIQVLILEAAKAVDMNAMKLRFNAGVKSYGILRTSLYTNTTNGVLVRYTENGRTWQSEIGDQAGSYFESVAFRDAATAAGRYSHVWRARFSCKVYFNGLPPKTLQNCEIFVPAFFR